MKRAFLTRLACLLALFSVLSVGATAQPAYRFAPLDFLIGALTNDGTMLGYFPDSITEVIYNLRTRQGEYRSITVPGAVYTNPLDINNSGTVVGNYESSDGTWPGFILSPRGLLSTYSATDAITTTLLAVTDSGLVLGQAWYGGDEASYFLLYPNGTHQELNYPGSYGPYGIGWFDVNNSGMLMGIYVDDFYYAHGVVARESQVTEIIIPGALAVYPAKINNRGEVAGSYLAPSEFGLLGGLWHGFVRDLSGRVITVDYNYPWPQTITVPSGSQTLSGTLFAPIGTSIYAQNERGQVAGVDSAFYVNSKYGFSVDRYFIATPASPGNH